MTRLSLLFAGAGEFGLPTLRALLAHHTVLHVYTQLPRPAGRGRKLTPTPIAEFLRTHHPTLPLTETPDLNAEPLPPADALVVIAFGQKIAPHVTAHPRLGALNLHASRLPKYRGAAPIHRALQAGETVTGNSIIRLAPKMDAGPVLAMSALPILPTETTGELHDRLAEDGAPLVLQVLADLAAGTATETEQDHTLATLAKKITRDQTLLDFSRPATELALQIRAFHPWPGCRVTLTSPPPDNTPLLKLTLAKALAHPPQPTTPDAPTLPPGHLLPNGHISTGHGTLEILSLQPEGGKLLPLPTYRNGHPWPPHATLTPTL